MKKFVAFVCGHNSGRSQMAQAAFNSLKKLFPKADSNYEAISWGTGIKENAMVNPKVISPMKEIGIDLSDKKNYFPKTADHALVKQKYPHVVRVYTMGCMDNTCVLPLGKKINGDWDLEDPAKETTDVTAVRDKIIGKTLELLNEFNKEK